MLDTDTVSFALRGEGNVAARIVEHVPSQLCISAITLSELRFGADKRGSRKLHRLIDSFTNAVEVAAFDAAAATAFGRLATLLRARGTPIGDFDTLIAAHALALGITLVTNNGKHFMRVAGLKTESWL
jgi:tRNA(fMet)-specific endonuclease VapC